MLFTLNHLPIPHSTIILRTDLNIPQNSAPIDEHRKFKALLRTISDLQAAEADQITILTHLGRPTHRSPEFSTKQFIPLLKEAGLDVAFIRTPGETTDAKVQLLENVRFFEEETKSVNTDFACELKKLGDVYIQDAFGSLHRDSCSMTTLAQQFSASNRGIGPLVENEIKELVNLKTSEEQPFVLVLGGSKIATKIGVLETFITLPSALRPQNIVLGGLLPLAFIEQEKLPHGQKSSADDIAQAGNITKLAFEHNVTITLPTDFGYNDQGNIVDLGSNSLEKIDTILVDAKKIFINGTMGYYEDEKSAQGTRQVLTTIAQLSDALCVAGGGDASAAIDQYGLGAGFDFVSTGGGATLAFLVASDPEHELPGLNALT